MSGNAPQSSQIFDRHGTLLYTIYASRNQTFVPLSIIPKNVQHATIAVEDKDFYHHGALDFKGIARALFSIVVHKQIQGGSTLTQQLVKNSLLNDTRQTIVRKIKEAILAMVTELIYPKDKILEMYLNQTPYGGTSWGIQAASLTYFGKEAKDLDLAESALLAGLPEAPTTFSPFGSHPELAKERQSLVLQDMLDQGYITKTQYHEAVKETLKYQEVANNILAPHFSLYVKDLLEKKYGAKEVEQGGLKVITSLDLPLQNYAQGAVASEVANLGAEHVTNGAAMVTEPLTGEILAMIGSKDYFDATIGGTINVAISGSRQPGSSIKPINYAVGLLHGYSPATPFVDQATCFTKDYCPVNYDGKFHGLVSLRTALGNSFNIPAVKMLKVNGVEAMIATASAMGITTFTDPARYGLSLTLGGGEVPMIEMMTAYGVFATEGYRVDIHPILKVTDAKGNILEAYDPTSAAKNRVRVLPASVTYIMTDMLSDNNARMMEFGPSSSLVIKGYTVAAKTGTTNDFRDNWTFGYTPSYVVGAWVGNNDYSKMSSIASGITGAAPIWHDIMSHLLEGGLKSQFAKPSTVVSKFVCAQSGLLPPADGTANKCPVVSELFVKGMEPYQMDPGLQNTWIDKTTQDLPKPGQTDNLELKPEYVVTDPTGDRYCVTCNHPTPSPTPKP